MDVQPDQFSYLGITYHPHDFVYLEASADPDSPYQIAQVTDFSQDGDEFQVVVQLWARYDDVIRREVRAGGNSPYLKTKDEVCILLLKSCVYLANWAPTEKTI